MKRGPDKKDLSPAQNALARMGILDGTSFAHALIGAGGFTIPILPKRGRTSASMTQGQFTDLILGTLNGLTLARACGKAGLTATSARRWLRDGRKDMDEGVNTAQACFARTYLQAEALGCEYLSQTMLLHAQTDWRAAHAMLKDRYGVGRDSGVEEIEDSVEDTEKARRDRLRASLPKYAAPDVIDAEEPDDHDDEDT